MKHVAIVLLLAAPPAAAGGMVLPIQGVHSLERAGALIAGASDADELQPLHDASAAPTFVNAGTYRSYYILAGIRAARRF